MKQIKRVIVNMSFRKRLLFTYIVLISIPLLLFGNQFYQLSSDVMAENAQLNAYQIVKKNNEIIDTKLGQINQTILSFIADKDLYATFAEIKPDSDYYINLMDIRVSNILNKYFATSNDIYSTQLATSKYTFMNRPAQTTTKNFIPKGVFKNTDIYKIASGQEGKIIWVPTYDFSDMFHVDYIKGSNIEYKNLFSVIQMMNKTYFNGYNFLDFPDDIERPVLIVNMKEDFYHNVFDQSIPLEGSYYFVVTQDGKVVSHQNKDDVAKTIEIPWLADIVEKESGTDIVEYLGEKMIICYDTSTITHWISVVLIPYHSVIDKIKPTIMNYMILYIIGLILVSIFISYFISGLITKPIITLRKAIRKTGQGHFNSQVDEVGSIEIRELITKFNEMNTDIQLLIQEKFEKELKEKDAEILALNLQLDPHFMYNTLNLINLMMIETGQDEISELMDSLSSMLKYTVKNKKSLVSFEEDLVFLKSYIAIMTKRFEGKHDVEFDIDERIYHYDVPKFLLQPFVENTFVHAFNSQKNKGFLKVTCWIEDYFRYFSIEDNGCGITSERLKEIQSKNSNSIGISNVDSRIKLVYGNEYGVEIKSAIGEGTQIFIRLPLLTS